MLRKNANNRKSNLLSRFRQRQQRRGKRTMGTETLEGRQLLATSPILLGLAPNVTYNENTVNTAPQVIDSNVFLIDDGPNFNGGSVTVSYSAGGSAQDNLTVINTDNGTGTTTDDITVSGSNISYGGVQIGTMSGGSSGSSLNVSLNASATPTAVDRLLESLAYGNSSDSPAGSRTIRVDVNDGADPAAAPRFTIINVTAENEKDFGDAPASYGTAEHTNSATGIPQSRLNGAFDAESVANSSANAQGDDTYGADDEADAVNANRFAPGFAVDLNIGANVHSTVGSIISAWVDYNIDGDFNDAGERVITNAVVANGNNAFTINVPQTATPGTTFMRVRITDNDGDNLNSATATRDSGEAEDYQITIYPVDYGDGPFQATLAANGARHAIFPGVANALLYLGEEADGNVALPTVLVDAEFDAPDAGEGQTTDHFPDEVNAVNVADQGVRFDTPLAAGTAAQISVLVGGSAGILDAWIDFDNNGTFDPINEKLNFNEGPVVTTGLQARTFTVPATAVTGQPSNARFRLSTAGGLLPTGQAQDGEVEDYSVFLAEPIDFGDAPASYGSASHDIIAGFHLGSLVDVDTGDWHDGTDDNGNASDDDLQGFGDDDDGVVLGELRYGTEATVTVTASAPGLLHAWFDFNNNGMFDVAEQVFADTPLVAGANVLNFNMPIQGGGFVGDSYARFRFTQTFTGIGPTGPISERGEVEDYKVALKDALDFGDLDASYGNASHRYSGLTIGATWDAELATQASAMADGDDTDTGVDPYNIPDDEDGVTINNLAGVLVAGGSDDNPFNQVNVNASGAGELSAWVDFNHDGAFGAGEKVLDAVAVPAGTTSHTITVPTSATLGGTAVRFRLVASGTGSIGATGEVNSGEVEDYVFEVVGLDFGDLPDDNKGTSAIGHDGLPDYPVRRTNDVTFPTAFGPAHFVPAIPKLFLGNSVTLENDGQPSSNADQDVGDDGVDFDFIANSNVTPIVYGRMDNKVEVTVTDVDLAGANLDGWIDFNKNGVFTDPGEQIFASVSVTNGSNVLTYTVPNWASGLIIGDTFARFRLSTAGGLPSEVGTGDATSYAYDGEIEDYKVFVYGADYGDAHDVAGKYATLIASNGAGHLVDDGSSNDGIGEANHTLLLGDPTLNAGRVDVEANGQPSPFDTATLDDSTGPAADDEDGVVFNTPLAAGQPMKITVYASQAGKLDAFFDWNDDGDWDEPGEEVFDSLVLAAGANTLTVNVDPLVVAGNNITSRFRISPIGSPNLGSTGLAFSIGEVEDYTTIAVPPRDYGDAPASYGSASHTLVPSASFPILGPSVDVDTGDWHNGTDTSTMALDDDNEGFVPDDEAGVTWVAGDVRRGESFDIQVTVANATGRLNAWFDWNENGVFAGAEQVFTDVVLGVGTHTLTVNVPANARTVENPGAAGATYARFRIDTAGGLGATGLAPDGEVEDYKFLVNQAYDYGDAPDLPYETDLIGPVTLNPARHLLHVTPNLYLGAGVDSELDGQPSVIADGDDTDSVNPSANDLADDEDGVVFKDVLTRGLVSTIDVILPALSPGGILNAWIDFDASGTFDPAENLFGNQPVVAGTNTLTFLVPASATLVDSYARFRLSTAGSLTPAGTAADGEIEDYRVSIHDPISITGRKFEDRNLDGVRNPGEPYLAGWDIQLLDEDNNVLSTATTINVGPDPDTQHGIYTFTNVRPLTTYRVREVINASPLFNNWVATAPDFTGGSGLLLEIESNDTLATAQEIPQSTFQVGNQFNTQDSKVARHVTISGKGDGSVDHYELVVPQDNTRVVLDIDFGDQAGSPATSFDSYLELFTDTGTLITLNDDSLISDGAGGSTSGLDSFIDTTLDSGTYIIRVSDLINTTIATGKTYNLQVSLYDSPYELFQAPGANATGIDFGNRLRESDFGDAPNSYQTVVASNGPRHQITNLYLGSSVDSDLDGQPTAAADGDDVDAFFTAPDDVANDDDGVILAALIPGAAAHPVTVLASQTGGYLNAWIDFNKDGDFADAGEKIFTDVALVGGANNLTFPVPAAASGPTYARFRLSTQTGLGPGGFALDGEVEDYRVNVTAAQPLRFDFGPTGSPIESGYNLVSKATVYPGAGFGWSTGTVDDRDRGAPTDLTRDFGFSTDATFSANVSNGTYNVIATFGDNAFAHNNVGVFVEGNQVDTVSTTAGQFVTRTYVGVPVVDGKLDLRIAALPGGTTAVINALQIVPTVATYAYDFGTAGSPVAPGYTQVTPTSVLTGPAQFGWGIGNVVSARDRGAPDNLNRDFNFTSSGTFSANVANGTYFVSLTFGDNAFGHDFMQFIAEGTNLGTFSTTAGSFQTVTTTVAVTDGQFNLNLNDLGGADPFAVINRLELNQIGPDSRTIDSVFGEDDLDLFGLL